MKTIYRVYKERLVEITGKSRSLYSRSFSSKQSYNLGKLFSGCSEEAERLRDFLWNGEEGHFKLLSSNQINALIKDLKIDRITAAQKQGYLQAEQKRLTQLKREIEEIYKDTGRYEFFVGYPFVEGMLNKKIPIRAPLLLFPVKIDIEKEVELSLIKGEPIQLNKVFLLTYMREMRIKGSDIPTEFDDLREAFSSINEVIDQLHSQGIKIKYSNPRKAICNIDLSREATGQLEVRHACVLGRFPLANSVYYDYNQLLRGKTSSPPLETLLLNKTPKKAKKSQKNDYFAIHELDYAQMNALEKCGSRQHAVIYGPPGTGKSQTLAAIAIDNLCKERRTLVVSQKRSALDVVFGRLHGLNTKAVLLTDPDKNKTAFYAHLRARYDEIQAYKPQFDENAYRKLCGILEREILELSSISEAMFSTTSFGLTLQEMYSLSSNIAKSSLDQSIYTALKKSDIMKMDYQELSELCSSIEQRNKGKLFYQRLTLLKSNPFIDYIKTDIDIHVLNQVKAFLQRIIGKEFLPFNVSEYTYSRHMLVHRFEHPNSSLKPLCTMLAGIESPRLFKLLRLSYIPLFWCFFPFLKIKAHKKCKAIMNKLLTADNAIRHFVNEFALLEAILEREGLAMAVDSIAYGNDKFLKKLLSTLDDYLSLRSLKLAINSITPAEEKIILFAYENSKNQKDFHLVLRKILPIRIYHEVIEQERKKEQILSKTLIFEDLRKRINQLKNLDKSLSQGLSEDGFNQRCKQMFEADEEKRKNFLYQINKPRDLWPIRQLFEHFGEFLLNMFPCWLLSPEAVSSILPLKQGLGDVVLFDEASQLFIESTIPAIYRAKSLVVAGDDKQLRPTSVFVKRYMGNEFQGTDTDLNTQALMEVESLLDLASTRLNPTHLTYHYRSHYEELINFSNCAFYKRRLQIAPNISKNKDYLPIERIKVEGIWADRHNHEEATEVVRLVKHIFKTRKNNESIGIVTFNSDQEEYIKDLLDKERRESSQFRRDYTNELNRTKNGTEESIFVKNLENVQGDERDIIIFSIAYAKNKEGRLSSQFGSLSLVGGENRLNVAITRAVKKIYVVTSVEPEEFTTVRETKNLGPKLLVKYLQYARAVSQKNNNEAKEILQSLCPQSREVEGGADDLLESLKREIERLGYSVEANLGNADYKISLAVYDEELDRYLLGIEYDYNAYKSSLSMMERDVYRISFLNERGWDIMRVWSRDWWLNKNSVIKQIEVRINANKKRIYGENRQKPPSKKAESLEKRLSKALEDSAKKATANEIAATKTKSNTALKEISKKTTKT